MILRDDSFERRPPSAVEQMEGTMFDLSRPPVPSVAVHTSEQAADLLNGSTVVVERRWEVLRWVVKYRGSVDRFLAHKEAQTGKPVKANSYAPRFSELDTVLIEKCDGRHGHPLRREPTRSSTEDRTFYAYCWQPTNLGLNVLRQEEAARITHGGSFGPPAKEDAA